MLVKPVGFTNGFRYLASPEPPIPILSDIDNW